MILNCELNLKMWDKKSEYAENLTIFHLSKQAVATLILWKTESGGNVERAKYELFVRIGEKIMKLLHETYLRYLKWVMQFLYMHWGRSLSNRTKLWPKFLLMYFNDFGLFVFEPAIWLVLSVRFWNFQNSGWKSKNKKG